MGKRRPPDRIEVDPTMLTNIPFSAKEPKPGDPWEAYLFTHEIRGKERRKGVEAFSAPTHDELCTAIAEFVERDGVVLRDTDYTEISPTSIRPRAVPRQRGERIMHRCEQGPLRGRKVW